jgi:hypothetical protein
LTHATIAENWFDAVKNFGIHERRPKFFSGGAAPSEPPRLCARTAHLAWHTLTSPPVSIPNHDMLA